MSLQKYVRQLNPRDDTYVDPVNKIQTILKEAIEFQKYRRKENRHAKNLYQYIPLSTLS